MEQQPSFFDGRTVLAILIVGVLWVLWQVHLERKYPQAYFPNQKQSQIKTENQTAQSPASPRANNNEQKSAAPQVPDLTPPTSVREVLLHHEDSQWKFDLTSRGMGIRDLILKTYTNRANKPIVLGAKDVPLFATQLVGSKHLLDFNIRQTGSEQYEGVAQADGAEIVKTIKIDPKKFLFDVQLQVQHPGPQFRGIGVVWADTLRNLGGHFRFLKGSFKTNEVYVAHGTSHDYKVLDNTDQWQKGYSNVALVGLGSHYFDVAVLDRSPIMPQVVVKAHPKNGYYQSTLVYNPEPGSHGGMDIKYQAFAGPKKLSLLTTIDHRMGRLVNFGFFSILSRPLLAFLKWLYSLVGNYGVAIIILTLVTRLIVLPINIMAYRSMKAMQKIQPQLKALREKYKGDQKMLNQMTMALMKEHKVNPIGGCLPMLLQIPVFFALDRVLEQSVELYKAPFAFWIHDLSAKDPYFILPALMGGAMYFQQKLMPSAMDPAQAKMMAFMPLIMTIFMVGLPSGLTLYIFVTTLFGVIQQFIFVRDRGVASNSAALKATAK